MALVSIIIPSFERKELLTNCLKSLLEQTFMDWECIIICENTSENYFGFVEKLTQHDERFKVTRKHKNAKLGPSASRNIGIKLSQAKYIQFFDDDDEMYPNMLNDKVRKIQHLDHDVVVSAMDIFSVENRTILYCNLVYSKSIINDYILGNISWYVSGPLWKKSFIKEYFDLKVQTLDDWDFNLRNLYHSPKVCFLNQSLQRYNRFGRNCTLSTKEFSMGMDQTQSIFRVYRKHYKILILKNRLTDDLRDCLLKRMILLLRKSLLRKKPLSKEIFMFLIKESKVSKIKIKYVIIGYYSYRLLNRGYRFINY